MALFRRKKKDPRVEAISSWAQDYLEELGNRAGAAVSVESGPLEPGVMGEAPALDGPVVRERGAVPVAAEEPAESVEEEAVAQPEEQGALPAAEAEGPPQAVVQPDEEEIGVAEVEETAVEVPAGPSMFERLRSGLSRTRDGLVGRIDRLLSTGSKIDGQTFEHLEEILIESDIGVEQSLSLIEKIQAAVKTGDLREPEKIKGAIREEINSILTRQSPEFVRPEQGPWVIMVVGVNGVGKTTTIGKIAWRYREQGERVILAAGDTFRAAAAEQLEVWAERVGAGVIRHKSGADPSAVVFDALKAAEARGAQVVIADTAGRLHTKVNLMEELKKMKRVMGKVVPGAPHEVLLVLDATTGQNALAQARTFHEAVGVTGIVLTKLDGTAKGGIITAIAGELGLPVKLIGIGEGMEDLRDFEPEEFVSALFDD